MICLVTFFLTFITISVHDSEEFHWRPLGTVLSVRHSWIANGVKMTHSFLSGESLSSERVYKDDLYSCYTMSMRKDCTGLGKRNKTPIIPIWWVTIELSVLTFTEIRAEDQEAERRVMTVSCFINWEETQGRKEYSPYILTVVKTCACI